MKINKKLLLLSSIVCLLPMILSVMLYAQLPDQVAVHWNSSGEPNSFIHKAIAAYGLPIFLLAIHFCVFIGINKDSKRASHSSVMGIICSWLVPIASLLFIPMTLLISIGYDIAITTIVTISVGALFVVVGNYMPKSRRNTVMGIKVPWTISDDNNWNKTHRLAGLLWIIGGIGLIVFSFINPGNIATIWTLVILLVLLAAVPILYSFLLYSKKK